MNEDEDLYGSINNYTLHPKVAEIIRSQGGNPTDLQNKVNSLFTEGVSPAEKEVGLEQIAKLQDKVMNTHRFSMDLMAQKALPKQRAIQEPTKEVGAVGSLMGIVKNELLKIPEGIAKLSTSFYEGLKSPYVSPEQHERDSKEAYQAIDNFIAPFKAVVDADYTKSAVTYDEKKGLEFGGFKAIVGNVVQVAADMLPMIVSGGAGMLARGSVLAAGLEGTLSEAAVGARLAQLGNTAALANSITTTIQTFPDYQREAMNNGLSIDNATKYAVPLATLIGITEVIGAEPLVEAMGLTRESAKRVVRTLTDEEVKQGLSKLGGKAITPEMFSEFTKDVSQNVSKKLTNKSVVEGTWNAIKMSGGKIGSRIGNSLLHTGLAEGTEEFIQTGIEYGAKELYNNMAQEGARAGDGRFQDFNYKNFLTDAIYGFTLGTFMGGMSGAFFKGNVDNTKFEDTLFGYIGNDIKRKKAQGIDIENTPLAAQQRVDDLYKDKQIDETRYNKLTNIIQTMKQTHLDFGDMSSMPSEAKGAMYQIAKRRNGLLNEGNQLNSLQGEYSAISQDESINPEKKQILLSELEKQLGSPIVDENTGQQTFSKIQELNQAKAAYELVFAEIARGISNKDTYRETMGSYLPKLSNVDSKFGRTQLEFRPEKIVSYNGKQYVVDSDSELAYQVRNVVDNNILHHETKDGFGQYTPKVRDIIGNQVADVNTIKEVIKLADNGKPFNRNTVESISTTFDANDLLKYAIESKDKGIEHLKGIYDDYEKIQHFADNNNIELPKKFNTFDEFLTSIVPEHLQQNEQAATTEERPAESTNTGTTEPTNQQPSEPTNVSTPVQEHEQAVANQGEGESNQSKAITIKSKRRAAGTIKNPILKKALSLEATSPYDMALQYFIGGGKVSSSEIKNLFKGSLKELKQRIGLLNNQAGTAETIGEHLWESQPNEDQYGSHEFRNAVEQVLTQFNSPMQMANDLLFRHESKISEQERMIGSQLDELYFPEQSEEENNYDDFLLANLTDSQLEQLANDREEAEKDWLTKEFLSQQREEFKKKTKEELDIAAKEAKSNYDKLNKKYLEQKVKLEKNGQQDQLDIAGNAPSNGMLFKDDLSRQSKIVNDLKKQVDLAKEEYYNALADVESYVGENQQEINFNQEEKLNEPNVKPTQEQLYADGVKQQRAIEDLSNRQNDTITTIESAIQPNATQSSIDAAIHAIESTNNQTRTLLESVGISPNTEPSEQNGITEGQVATGEVSQDSTIDENKSADDAQRRAIIESNIETIEAATENWGTSSQLEQDKKTITEVLDNSSPSEVKLEKDSGKNDNHLNPIGSALQQLELQKGTKFYDSFRQIADILGDIRNRFPVLTNSHEEELFEHLTGDNNQFETKQDVENYIKSRVGEKGWKSKNNLGLEQSVDENAKMQQTDTEFEKINEHEKKALLDRLQQAFPNSKIQLVDNMNQLKGESLSNSKGQVYGYLNTKDGIIYLDNKLFNSNTPIHEFGHLWSIWAKQWRPDLYQTGIKLVSDSSVYMDKVNSNPNYSKLTRQEKLEEALAMAIGDKGESFVTSARKGSFKSFLDNLFDGISKYFGLRNLSGEKLSQLSFDDFTSMVAADLLSGSAISNITPNDAIALANSDRMKKMASGTYINSLSQLKLNAQQDLTTNIFDPSTLVTTFGQDINLLPPDEKNKAISEYVKQNKDLISRDLINTYGYEVTGWDKNLQEFKIEFVGNKKEYHHLGFMITANGDVFRFDKSDVQDYVNEGFVKLYNGNSKIRTLFDSSFLNGFTNIETVLSAFDYGGRNIFKEMITDNIRETAQKANYIRNILIEPMRYASKLLTSPEINDKSNNIDIQVWDNQGNLTTENIPISVAITLAGKYMTQMESYQTSTLVSDSNEVYVKDKDGNIISRKGGLWKKREYKKTLLENALSWGGNDTHNVWLLMPQSQMDAIVNLFTSGQNQTYTDAFDAIKDVFNQQEVLSTLADEHKYLQPNDTFKRVNFYSPLSAVGKDISRDGESASLIENSRELIARKGKPDAIHIYEALEDANRYVYNVANIVENARVVLNLSKLKDNMNQALSENNITSVAKYLDTAIDKLNNYKAYKAKFEKTGAVRWAERQMSRFTKSVFAFNIGLPAKQLGTFIAALGVHDENGKQIIETQYLLKNMGFVGRASLGAYTSLKGGNINQEEGLNTFERKYVDEILGHKEYATIYQRLVGNQETFVNRVSFDDVVDNYGQEHLTKLGEAARAYDVWIDKYGMSAMKKADRGVILGYYLAAKDQARAEGLTDGTQDFIDRVKYMTESVMYKTNQMNAISQLTKMQTSTEFFDKLLGLYSGQQQKLLNMVYQDYISHAKDPSSTLKRNNLMSSAFWAIGFNAIYVSLITTGVSALKKALAGRDQEDADFYAKQIGYNTARNLIGTFPSWIEQIATSYISLVDDEKWTQGIFDVQFAEEVTKIMNVSHILATVPFNDNLSDKKKEKQYNNAWYLGTDSMSKLLGIPNFPVSVARDFIMEDDSKEKKEKKKKDE